MLFSVEGDDYYSGDGDPGLEVVSIDTFSKKPDVIGSFKAQEVKETGHVHQW